MAEINSNGQGRLFSLNYSRLSAIRAHLTANDVVLLFYRDGNTANSFLFACKLFFLILLGITVFPIPSAGKTMVNLFPILSQGWISIDETIFSL